MKKFFFMVLTFLFSAATLIACTTFFIHKNGQFAFGRNYDWITDAGMVCSNLRGLAKTSIKMPEGRLVKWISKYGSITFNQYGKEFPNGGMNEAGLVVEMMWLDGSEYPKPDKRPSLYVLQWIQYQLDNCSRVKDVLATNKKIRISRQGNAPVHYLIADAGGDAATIEFLNGKMVVHRGTNLPLPVLANTSYATSSKLVMDAEVDNDDGKDPASSSYSDNSVRRFAHACSMVRKYQQQDINVPIVDYSFQILDKVNQPEFTKWSIVYDINNKTVYFKTASFTYVKSVAFADVDLSCDAKAMSFDMNQPSSGSVGKMLAPFTNELNMTVMSRAVTESKNQLPFNDEFIRNSIAYASAIHCSKN
ncbi:MAG TPA: linear amide C-N hydrolase [Flavitalea sp.]|nr:linear amide C-N hydrolase [Flavitalea sp.]